MIVEAPAGFSGSMAPSSLGTLTAGEVAEIIQRALDEDLGHGDMTTELTVGPEVMATGRLVAREAGVICGLGVAEIVFRTVDPKLLWTGTARDGDYVPAGRQVAIVEGPARGILAAERVALNLLQRMSGIATRTRRYVGAVEGTKARILDTRKTAPGLRVLDKYAVRCSGGHNHRFGLFDGVLVKDNHIEAAGGVAEAVRRARERAPHLMKIEVEVNHVDQIEEALTAGADILLIDNMTPSQLTLAVSLIEGRAATEASGGVDLQSVRAVADSGVDYISVGELTHSVRALDIALDLVM